jgi:hypothetical protein
MLDDEPQGNLKSFLLKRREPPPPTIALFGRRLISPIHRFIGFGERLISIMVDISFFSFFCIFLETFLILIEIYCVF